MSYKFIFEDKGFLVTFYGDISLDELNKATGEIQGHDEFDTHRYQVIDFREANISSVSKEDTQEPAVIDAVAAMTNFNVRIAQVASDTDTFNICKEYAEQSKEFGSPWVHGIFYDFNEALKWAKAKA